MVKWMRSIRVSVGCFPEAVRWSKEIAAFIAANYEDVQRVEVYTDLFGEMRTIRWVIDYPDLATLEKVGSQIAGDQEYWKRVNEAKSLFVERSMVDVAMKAL